MEVSNELTGQRKMPISIDSMILEYREANSDYVRTDVAIIEILEAEGKLSNFSRAEIEAAKNSSVFGSGYGNRGWQYGVTIERTNNSGSNAPARAESAQHWMAPTSPTEVFPAQAPKQTATNGKTKPYEPVQPNPMGNLELAFFMIINSDVLQDMISEPVGNIQIPKGKHFKTLEEAAEYILKKRGKSCTKNDIDNLARELIILN